MFVMSLPDFWLVLPPRFAHYYCVPSVALELAHHFFEFFTWVHWSHFCSTINVVSLFFCFFIVFLSSRIAAQIFASALASILHSVQCATSAFIFLRCYFYCCCCCSLFFLQFFSDTMAHHHRRCSVWIFILLFPLGLRFSCVVIVVVSLMSHACWKITVYFFWVCPCRLIHLCFCRFSNRIDGVLRAGRVDLVARLMLFTIATSSIVKILSSPANPTSHMLLPTIVGSIARKTYSPASLSLYVLLPPAPSSFEKLSSLSTTRATVCSENVCHLGLADIRRKRGAEDVTASKPNHAQAADKVNGGHQLCYIVHSVSQGHKIMQTCKSSSQTKRELTWTSLVSIIKKTLDTEDDKSCSNFSSHLAKITTRSRWSEWHVMM